MAWLGQIGLSQNLAQLTLPTNSCRTSVPGMFLPCSPTSYSYLIYFGLTTPNYPYRPLVPLQQSRPFPCDVTVPRWPAYVSCVDWTNGLPCTICGTSPGNPRNDCSTQHGTIGLNCVRPVCNELTCIQTQLQTHATFCSPDLNA